MKTDLNILLIEDSDADAQLINRELRAADLSFHLTLIQDETELRRHLNAMPPDLILSDHGLPSFDGFTALGIVRQRSEEIPFIFVSGSNDQGMVGEMFERGATDFVYKRDLHDLVPAVQRALKARLEQSPEQPALPPVRVEFRLLPNPHYSSFRLLLCPECLVARDESGEAVDMVGYFIKHKEIVVLHYRCNECSARRASN